MEELGRGAYGIVYKGFLKGAGDSQVTLAVKKVDPVAQEGEKEFRNEVKAIGKTFLFKRPRPNWKDRRIIAVEISHGILYLHEECCEQILHCDIKPQNILLDESYSPRISDLGLAKLLRMKQTNTLTNIRGTKGRLVDLIEDDVEAMEDMEMMLEGVAQVHDPPSTSPYSIFSCEEDLSCGPVSRV
ncbi:receptor-like protein kinase 1 [Raphanus sativus]|nr:receptor-like protein kinase 1 [Raphanus sativus]